MLVNKNICFQVSIETTNYLNTLTMEMYSFREVKQYRHGHEKY